MIGANIGANDAKASTIHVEVCSIDGSVVWTAADEQGIDRCVLWRGSNGKPIDPRGFGSGIGQGTIGGEVREVGVNVRRTGCGESRIEGQARVSGAGVYATGAGVCPANSKFRESGTSKSVAHRCRMQPGGGELERGDSVFVTSTKARATKR